MLGRVLGHERGCGPFHQRGLGQHLIVGGANRPGQPEDLILQRVVQLVSKDELCQRGPGGHRVAQQKELLLPGVVVSRRVGRHVRGHLGEALVRLEQAEQLQLGIARSDGLGSFRLCDLVLGQGPERLGIGHLRPRDVFECDPSDLRDPAGDHGCPPHAQLQELLRIKLSAFSGRRAVRSDRRLHFVLAAQRDSEHGDERRGDQREGSGEAHALVAHPSDVSKARPPEPRPERGLQ